MKIKQKTLALVLMMSLTIGIAAYPTVANAETKCGGAVTSIIDCPDDNGKPITENGVWHLLILALNIMTAGVGVLAVGAIAYGAALYASSSDKPEQAKQGMTYIKNVVIGLVAYGLMFVVLNFLIPGGIFDTAGRANNTSPIAIVESIQRG